MTRYLLAAFIALVMTSALHADSLFSNLGPGDSFSSGFAFNVNWEPGYHNEQAHSFVVPTTGNFTLQRIELPISEDSFGRILDPSTMNVSLRSDADGHPADSILEEFFIVRHQDTPAILHALDSVVRPTLQAGAKYWIVADPVGPLGVSFLWWAYPAPDWWTQRDGMMARQNGGPWLAHPQGEAALRVTAVLVPEPSTLAMLLGALPLAYLAYRRR